MSGKRSKAIHKLFKGVVLGTCEYPQGALYDRMFIILRENPERKTRSVERAFRRAYLEAKRNGSRFRPLPRRPKPRFRKHS